MNAGRCARGGCLGETELRFVVPRFEVRACTRCGLWQRDPFPDAAEIDRMYSDPAYVDSVYFASQREVGGADTHPEVAMYAAGLDWLEADLPAERRRLLDVGSGTGFFLKHALARGWHCEGMDVSPVQAERARVAHGVTVHVGDFGAVALPEAHYDAITLWDVLEHVTDPAATLQRAHTLLRPGGALVILTIDAQSLLNRIAHLAYRLTGGRLARPIELLYDARHCYYFSEATLTALLDAQGFALARRERHPAHLDRWLSEPAPGWLVLGGKVVDAASRAVRLEYRQLVIARRAAGSGARG